ncbi:hypothetical protein BTZ13_05035 [Staphylococcus condimenti]|uniref:B domain-containing protein n=1 Tax=Staphylococcus condimenti TaxID=70255 RepID=UPI0009475CEC|nr:B domain-containing protein [Staphylococcus condimenti]APR60607.1 hypothetical protein BTZ13_05035 [Staphylococcus condimenti]MDK8645528.1 B domain-containing protein [Staphylococcus condimenti]
MNKKQHRISLIKMGIASATLAALLACGNAAQAAEKNDNADQAFDKDYTLVNPETGVTGQQQAFYELLKMDNLTEQRKNDYIETIKVNPQASQEAFASAIKENRNSTEVHDGQQNAFVNIYHNEHLTNEQKDVLIEELKEHPERAQNIFTKSLKQQNLNNIAKPELPKEEKNEQSPKLDTENVPEPPMITVPLFDNPGIEDTVGDDSEDSTQKTEKPDVSKKDSNTKEELANSTKKEESTDTAKKEESTDTAKKEENVKPPKVDTENVPAPPMTTVPLFENPGIEDTVGGKEVPEALPETKNTQPNTWERISQCFTTTTTQYYNSVKNYYNSAYNSVSGFYNSLVNKYTTAKSFYTLYSNNQNIIDKVVNTLIGTQNLKSTNQALATYPTLTDKSTTYDYIKYPFTYLSVGTANAFTTIQNTYNSYYNTYQTASSLYQFYKENPKKVEVAVQTAKVANNIISSISSFFGFSK